MFARNIIRLGHVFRVRAFDSSQISRARVSHPFTTSPLMAHPNRPTSGEGIPTNMPPTPPKVFPHNGFDIIDPSLVIEEETLPFDRPGLFYPVRLGEVLQDRYQVAAKLGYGASSTVWLSHDLVEQRYVVLKIFVCNIPQNPELKVLNHLNNVRSEHNGREFMRLLESSFRVQGPEGEHDVLCFPPLGLSVQALQNRQPKGVYYEDIATSTAQCALIALNFLHEEAKVIHTDIHSGNLLLGISDKSLLAEFEQKELEKPTPRKVLEDREIYVSQVSFDVDGVPRLCDFGHSRICTNGQAQYGRAMPIQYRTPEMLLDMPWDYSVDLWALALTIWDLLEPKPLFEIYDATNSTSNEALHLAHMVALMGPPPLGFLKKSETSWKYWDRNGNWKGVVPLPPSKTFESLLTSTDGERKALFLDFIRSLLKWDPQQRCSSGDAYFHPWLAEVRGDAE